jgi:hypothetical protein
MQMTNELGRMLPMLLFGLVLLGFARFKPRGTRLFIGVFFALMGIAINATLVVLNPQSFVALGDKSFIPFYRWAFTSLVAPQPAVWGGLVAAFEVTAGLLMITRGPTRTIGLLAGILLLLTITPFGWEELPSPLMAAALVLLLTAEESPRVPRVPRAPSHLRPAGPPLRA